MSDKIRVDVRGHVLTIGLDRPEKKNAIDVEMMRGLATAYTQLAGDPQLRCGVLWAEGEHFTAGLDLPDFMPRFAQAAATANDDAAGAIMMGEDDTNPFGLPIGGMPERPCTKPVVVAVHGRCFTAGIELCLGADVCIASSDSVFAQAEVRRGLFPLGAATIRFPQVFGWGNGMRWLLTGDPFDAEEALRIGLVQEIVAPGQQLERAMAIAERIASAAPIAVQGALANARLAMTEGAVAAARDLAPRFRGVLASQDIQEGVRSLIEKRAPRFEGR